MSDSPKAADSFNYVEQANVVVQHVSKSYVITPNGAADTNNRRVGKKSTVVDAIIDANLVAYPGESIGLIGLNGSGKSTLLKMISGGLSPTSGTILTSSQPTLMGVSSVLQKTLSGEQNIELGCLALGMSPAQAREQIPKIAEWTELEDAIKRPMSTYSSGMSARLTFAISTAVKPEILLIDEALSTGDVAFADKAKARMRELLGNAGSLFLVSHAIGQIEQNCKRTLWISKGRIIADGPTDEVAPMYHEWARLLGKDNKEPAHQYLQEIVDSYISPLVILDHQLN